MIVPNPENDLYSDAMDAAASYSHGVRHGAMRNAERTGEQVDGETVARRALAAGINAYLNELGISVAPVECSVSAQFPSLPEGKG